MGLDGYAQLGPREAIPSLDSRTPYSMGETLRFHSQILGETRVLNVYIPDSYEPDLAQGYPVIYVLDGSRDEDFLHLSGLVQFLSFPWVGALPPSLVVGIANVDRRRDYTFPTRVEADKKQYPTTGGSKAFIRFLQQEVIPLVDSLYSTGERRTLIGQSLGGLLATEILLEKPELFSRYMLVSPSLWWDQASILTRPVPSGKGAEVYLMVGKEGKDMVRPARKLARKLKPHHQLSFQYYRRFNHGNILHQAVYDAFMKGAD